MVRALHFHPRGTSLIPDQGTKILLAAQLSKRKKKINIKNKQKCKLYSSTSTHILTDHPAQSASTSLLRPVTYSTGFLTSSGDGVGFVQYTNIQPQPQSSIHENLAWDSVCLISSSSDCNTYKVSWTSDIHHRLQTLLYGLQVLHLKSPFLTFLHLTLLANNI